MDTCSQITMVSLARLRDGKKLRFLQKIKAHSIKSPATLFAMES